MHICLNINVIFNYICVSACMYVCKRCAYIYTTGYTDLPRPNLVLKVGLSLQE